MGGMGDLVPLIVVGGVAYYVLVVNPSILSSLTPAAAATPAVSTTPAASGASTTSTSTTPCQGKDPSGAPCACPPTSTAAVVYAYKSSKSKSSGKSGGSKSSGSSKSSSACDCSACGGTASTTKQTNTKSNTVKGGAGYADLNAYAGSSIANEGLGFNALQAYHRRYW